jgi:enoyl-CoA hydratase/carnithine racemase
MPYDFIAIERRGAVATMLLNRPDVLNALNWQMRGEMEQALDELDDDPAVKVVIMRGAGRAFCAGAYVKGQDKVNAIGFYSRHTYLHRLFYRFTKFRKPLIAAIHGYCLGMGLEFALLCDILIASDDAKFGEPEINLGETYGIVRLPRLVGEKRAMWISLSGEMFSAPQAEQWGLVSKVVPREQLEAEAEALAQKLAQKSATAMWFVKEAMKASMSMDPQSAFVLESMAESLSQTSPDYLEGVTAFQQKRAPKFDHALPGTRFENVAAPATKKDGGRP